MLVLTRTGASYPISVTASPSDADYLTLHSTSPLRRPVPLGRFMLVPHRAGTIDLGKFILSHFLIRSTFVIHDFTLMAHTTPLPDWDMDASVTWSFIAEGLRELGSLA